MPKWVPVPKPDAELTLVQTDVGSPVAGQTTRLYVTANGVRFARIEDTLGVVNWWQAVEE